MTELLSRPASSGTAPQPVGSQLKDWRQRRRLSQLDLALEAGISARHLSFLETGRSRPSRDMLLMLAEKLEVPLRERNGLLVSAGFAPVFPQRRLDDPTLAPARRAIELVLKGHEPYPALALDRHWHMISANAAVAPLLEGVAGALLTPPVNVLRLSLHPDGLAPRILNFTEWRAHLLERLQRQIDLTADTTLVALMGELKALPAPPASRHPPVALTDYAGMVVPLRLRMAGEQELAFFSTTTLFGTPVDVTLAELAIEAFFPADAATAAALSAATATK